MVDVRVQPDGTPTRHSLLRAILTLLAGGAAAQAVPLLLGPWLARLYTEAEYGLFTTFSAVVANLAVLACARYEFALPMARDEAEARDLLALCLRVLMGVTLATSVLAALHEGLRMAGLIGRGLPLVAWMPLGVLAAGLVQCLVMWATRAQRFSALAGARSLQYSGASLAQGLAGTWHAGVTGLVLAPVACALAASAWLSRPAPLGGWRALWRVPLSALSGQARQHRDFPLFNAPHAFLGALQDTLTVLLLAWWSGDAAVGLWGFALRYLKAPAGLMGQAVSQALYPKLVQQGPEAARRSVRQVMALLALASLPLVGVLLAWGPDLFAWAFSERWRAGGELAQGLSLYLATHFVAAPLAVVTMAWQAQGWALRLSVVGQCVFLAALGLGLWWGGLMTAAWCISGAMSLYFGYYFWSLATWPLDRLPQGAGPGQGSPSGATRA